MENEMIWAMFYFALASLITALTIHLIYHNWGYIWKYRVTKWFTLIATPIFAFTALSFYIEASLIFLRGEELTGLFPKINKIWSLVILGFLVLVGILLLAFVGKNWLTRMRHRWNQYFGPYVLFGEDPSTQVIICWGNGLRPKVFPELPEEFEDQIAQVIKIGTSKDHLVNKMNKIYINDRICYIQLTNLKPNQIYYYRIPRRFVFTIFGNPFFTKDRRLHSFKTGLPKGSSTAFEFVAVSDMHASGAPIGETVKIIKRLMGHQHDINFVVTSGDNVSDARILTHWRNFTHSFPSNTREP